MILFLANGNVIPKGASVAIYLFGMGYNPKTFVDPMEFKPDRFLPENRENKNPYEYVPFSAGPRNCIGKNVTTNKSSSTEYFVKFTFLCFFKCRSKICEQRSSHSARQDSTTFWNSTNGWAVWTDIGCHSNIDFCEWCLHPTETETRFEQIVVTLIVLLCNWIFEISTNVNYIGFLWPKFDTII